MSNLGTEGGIALADYAQNRPMSTDAWKVDGDWDPEWAGHKRGGSANIDMLGNACWLIYGNEEQRKTMVDAWINFFTENKTNFQRTEQLSIIYSCVHLVPVLAVYRFAQKNGLDHLYHASRNWLMNWWSLMWLSSAKLASGRRYSVICGERSMGMPLDNYFGHHSALAEALGEDWPRREKAINGPWNDEVNDWINRGVVGFSQEIRETAQWVMPLQTVEDVAAISPQYTFRTPVYFYKTANGTMCWWGHNNMDEDAAHNNNTGPLMMLKCENGKLRSAPEDGGIHWRQKAMWAGTEYDPERKAVKYLMTGAGYQEAGNIHLPDGEIIAYIKIGDGRWWNMVKPPELPPVEPPVDPPKPPEPPKKKKSNIFMSLLELLFSFLGGKR